MTVQQQKDILEHTHNLLTKFNFGIPPKVGRFAKFKGYRLTQHDRVALLHGGRLAKRGPNYCSTKELNTVCVYLSIPCFGCTYATTDHSSMAHEWVVPPSICLHTTALRDSCQAYYMRDADSWTKIDYSARAETWMKPLRKGNETGLVCIPANWLV